MTENRWNVKYRDGEWRIYDGPHWHDTCPTLPDAHSYATQLAVADVLFNEGGLTRLKELKHCQRIVRKLI